MKIKENDSLLDKLTLVLYFVLSPFLFKSFYPDEIRGNLGIFLYLVLGITCITSLFSLLIIFLIKSDSFEFIIELTKAIIVMAISTFLIFLLSGIDKDFFKSFIISNSLEIILLYSLLIYYKFKMVSK